jgi:hypothetical protein
MRGLHAADRIELTRRELLWLIAGACLLAVVFNWPLILHLGETIPKDLGDPLPQSWQLAWGGYALAHQPLEFFQSNQFWPLDDTLAFSDALIGYAPAGLIGSGPEDAAARYDLLFLFAYALSFVGAYLLARELGLRPIGAAVAGAAFAFAPFRLEQDGHLHVISSGGIALALALGLRGYRLRRPWWVFAGFAVASWQFTLGPTLGLPLSYLLGLLGLSAAIVWWRRRRPSLPRPLVVATVAGVAVFIATAALIAQPYLRVADEQPDAQRPPSTIEAYSDAPQIFAVAPAENLIWGGATAPIRDGLENAQEKTLFPGLVVLGLAIAGVLGGPLPRRLRVGIGAGVLGVSILALGFQESGGLLWPYRLAYEVLPGWDGMRTPGRLFTFATIGLAILAGAGAVRASGALRARGARPALAVVLAGLLALAIAIEGRGLPFDPTDSLAQPRVPVAPADVSDVPAPQLHLPAPLATDNRRYLFWSTDGFPAIVNGRSSVQPEFTQQLIDAMDDFPDRASVELLRERGVQSVILHLARVKGTAQEHAAERPVADLGIGRERLGGVIVYDLRSPSASSAVTPVG